MGHHQEIQDMEDKQIILQMGLFPSPPARKNFSEELGKFKIGDEKRGRRKGCRDPLPLREEYSVFVHTWARNEGQHRHTHLLFPLYANEKGPKINFSEEGESSGECSHLPLAFDELSAW